MKNNKGMTIVEVIISLVLISIVIIFLFNLLITVKNYTTQNNNATDLLINQSVIVKAVEKDMNEYHLKGIENCTDADINTTGRLRIVPKEASNIYCLKLTFDNNRVNPNNVSDELNPSVGYLISYRYKYNDVVYKNVVGYKRGASQTIREMDITMDPISNPGSVTSSCTGTEYSTCSLKITLPVLDNKGNNYDIIATYIYKSNSLTYKTGTANGFQIR